MKDLEYYFNELPSDIEEDGKVYRLFVTPYTIAYMNFDNNKSYHLLYSICEYGITDKIERIKHMCEKMLEWTKNR